MIDRPELHSLASQWKRILERLLFNAEEFSENVFFCDFVDKSFEKLQTCHNENVERFFKTFAGI